MRLRCFQGLTRRIFLCIGIAAGIQFLASAGAAGADDLPTFRPGLWEFNRTVETPGNPEKPQTLTNTECTNPTEDMKRQKEMVTKTGCKISPAVRKGKTYTYATECRIQGITAQSTSVMTVESDAAYSIKVESRSSGQSSNELLRARRTGDCSK